MGDDEGKKVYVGKLSYDTDEESLRARFDDIGEVEEAIVIKDRETERSRGFGFVVFRNAQDVQTAIDKLDGEELDGRTIMVAKANSRRGGGGGGGGRSGGGFRSDRSGGYGGGGYGGGRGGGRRGGGYSGGGGYSSGYSQRSGGYSGGGGGGYGGGSYGGGRGGGRDW